MINAKLYKKVCAYLIDISVCALIAFSLLCFIELFWPNYTYLYVLSGFVFTYLIYFFLISLLLKISKGKTLGYLIFGLRLVKKMDKPIPFNKILIKVSIEGFLICEVLDAIFIGINHTEIGSIERVSDTFIIDERY